MLFDLPPPKIIKDLGFEEILDTLMIDVRNRFEAVGVNYDLGNLEVDPVKIVQETNAFRETILRSLGNDIIKENLIAFATQTNLDHLAAFYGVLRLTGENDERLRTRVALAISGRSTAGGADWYKLAAMTASVDVRDVAVYLTGIGPEIEIAILSYSNGGVASQALIDTVNAAIQSPSVRVISDRITVVRSSSVTVNVAARVRLLPDAPQSVFDELEDAVRQAWNTESGIGFDLRRSWLISKLHQPGVSTLELVTPVNDVAVEDKNSINLGTISLTYMGRSR